MGGAGSCPLGYIGCAFLNLLLFKSKIIPKKEFLITCCDSSIILIQDEVYRNTN